MFVLFLKKKKNFVFYLFQFIIIFLNRILRRRKDASLVSSCRTANLFAKTRRHPLVSMHLYEIAIFFLLNSISSAKMFRIPQQLPKPFMSCPYNDCKHTHTYLKIDCACVPRHIVARLPYRQKRIYKNILLVKSSNKN